MMGGRGPNQGASGSRGNSNAGGNIQQQQQRLGPGRPAGSSDNVLGGRPNNQMNIGPMGGGRGSGQIGGFGGKPAGPGGM